MLRRCSALVAVVCLAVAGCSSDDAADDGGATSAQSSTVAVDESTLPELPTTTLAPPSTLPVPEGDAFYIPPDPLPDGEPGDPIWWVELPGAPLGATGYRVLYQSVGVTGDPVAVSGIVVVPDVAVPEDGRPIMAWAHGTTGLADECAPSRFADPYASIVGLEQALGLGYLVVASDYEGLGTPGPHPYLDGASAARSVLDIARAARRLPDVQASNVVSVVGHSQGGHAALFTGELSLGYARDLEIRLVAAGAPVGDLVTLFDEVKDSQWIGLGVAVAYGLAAANPTLDLDDVLTPEIQAVADPIIETGCVVELLTQLARPPDQVFVIAPSENTDWLATLEANSPGQMASPWPVFVFQGADDDLIPATQSDTLVAKLCDIGTPVRYRVYDGADHITVVERALPDIELLLRQGAASDPFPADCGKNPGVDIPTNSGTLDGPLVTTTSLG